MPITIGGRTVSLRIWNTGDPLLADDLNANFLVLFSMITAINTVVGLVGSVSEDAARALGMTQRLAEQLRRVEENTEKTERARNLKQYAPSAMVTELFQRLQSVEGPLRAEMAELKQEEVARRGTQDDLATRVASMEAHPAPPAPSLEQFNAMAGQLQQERGEARLAIAELTGLRAEIRRMRERLRDPDRGDTSKRVYAPMSVVGELARRIQSLEAPREQQARAETQTRDLRAELAFLKATVAEQAETSKREALLQKTVALLLQRVERLEAAR